MNDTVTHAAPSADTQQAKPAELKSTELKSKDSGVLSQIRAQAEKADTVTPPPKAEKPAGEKPASHAAPAGNGQPDAESSEAEHPDDRKIEPWMRKRLARAEDKGRKQALAEIVPHAVSEALRQVRGAPAPTEQPPPDPQPREPPKTLADFGNDIEDYIDHQVDEHMKRQSQHKAAEEAKRTFDTRKSEFERSVGEGAWEEMVTAEVDVPQGVVDLLKGHPRDLYIGHYLTQHPDELDSLRGKSALEIATHLAAIDARLNGTTTGAGKSVPKELPPKTTRAPAPPADLPSGTTAAKSIANMSTAERIAEWRREKAATRR